MKCLNCGSHNDSGTLRCQVCNVPMQGTFASPLKDQKNRPETNGEVICINCKTSNSKGSLKCKSCNAPLTGSMIISQNSHGHEPDGRIQCLNCGLHNSAKNKRCSDCNAPLDGSMVKKQNKTAPKEDTLVHENQDASLIVCPSCSYPNHNSASQCSLCKTDLIDNKNIIPKVPSVPADATINPWLKSDHQRFTLKVEHDNQSDSPEIHNFEGTEVELNREVLNSENTTITKKLQAKIFRKNGEWFISDHSEWKSTYVQAKSPIKLENGCSILLGNQKFEFNAE